MIRNSVSDTPLCFDDLTTGDRWISEEREITRDCVFAFAQLTGDNDPLHVDEEYARSTPFRQPVAHGLLGLSLLAGLSSTCPRVETLAFTEIDQWQFKRPIYFGDTVHVETEVVDLHPHGARAGKVTWVRQLVNQQGQVVQQGTFETIVSARQASPSLAS